MTTHSIKADENTRVEALDGLRARVATLTRSNTALRARARKTREATK